MPEQPTTDMLIDGLNAAILLRVEKHWILNDSEGRRYILSLKPVDS